MEGSRAHLGDPTPKRPSPEVGNLLEKSKKESLSGETDAAVGSWGIFQSHPAP